MSFLYPIFLWGLIAVSIPIIIHLFDFRKARLIQFSNVRMLESLKKKSTSNRRLRHWLILLCRLLFILFLALTFAQPYLRSADSGTQKTSVSIYLDNSKSMSNQTHDHKDGLGEAIDLTKQIVNFYPKGTNFKFITNDFLPSANVGRTDKAVLDQLYNLDYSDISRSGKEVWQKLKTGIETENSDVFVISDFQPATYGSYDLWSDSLNTFHVLPIYFEQYSNVYVDSIYLKNPFLIPNQNNQLIVLLKNIGSVSSKDVIVKLKINDRQIASINQTIEAENKTEIVFEIGQSLQESNRCVISFEEYPVHFDNEYYFTLGVVKKINIVEIAENSTPLYTQKVFGENDLFNTQRFQPIDINYDLVEKSDFLIINGVNKLDNGLKSILASQLVKGKSVLFIPSTDFEFSKISSFLDIAVDNYPDTAKVALEHPDIHHPFFENIFESIDNRSMMPLTTNMLDYNASKKIILKDKSGKAFLSQIDARGNLFLMAAPLLEKYTNFQVHALFVPVMQRIAELSSSSNNQLYYIINDQNVSIQVDSLSKDHLYALRRDSSEMIPSQRANANQLVLDIPKYLLHAGHYDLTFGNQKLLDLAFDTPKSESILAPIQMDELKEKLKSITNINFYKSINSENFTQVLKEKYQSKELWKYTLILCLLFLLAETLLLRFYK